MSVVPKSKAASRADWCASADLSILQKRATLLARIRRFFAQHDVMEVETPVLSQAATTDPVLSSFASEYHGPGLPGKTPLYLHTSPEFFMKRLLADGAGSIYQIAHVFRDEEAGRLHNPEFTLLEWYRVGFSYQQLMDEIELLLGELCDNTVLSFPIQRMTYQQLFATYAAVDPFVANIADLKHCLQAAGHTISRHVNEDYQIWLDLVLTHVIEPQIQQGAFFIYDYPPEQAALARIRDGAVPVAERFELYINGVELANGFQELTNADEQRKRFDSENMRRRQCGLSSMPVDERFLQALESGLPDCSGVALGIDRLLMLLTGQQHIDQVIAFPLSRA